MKVKIEYDIKLLMFSGSVNYLINGVNNVFVIEISKYLKMRCSRFGNNVIFVFFLIVNL